MKYKCKECSLQCLMFSMMCLGAFGGTFTGEGKGKDLTVEKEYFQLKDDL